MAYDTWGVGTQPSSEDGVGMVTNDIGGGTEGRVTCARPL